MIENLNSDLKLAYECGGRKNSKAPEAEEHLKSPVVWVGWGNVMVNCRTFHPLAEYARVGFHLQPPLQYRLPTRSEVLNAVLTLDFFRFFSCVRNLFVKKLALTPLPLADVFQCSSLDGSQAHASISSRAATRLRRRIRASHCKIALRLDVAEELRQPGENWETKVSVGDGLSAFGVVDLYRVGVFLSFRPRGQV